MMGPYRWLFVAFALILWQDPTINTQCNEQSSRLFVQGFTTNSNRISKQIHQQIHQRDKPIHLQRRRFPVIDSHSEVCLLAKNDDNTTPSVSSFSLLLSSLAVASAILLSSAPAIATEDPFFAQSAQFVASSTTESLDVSELVKSLSPATASRPQIPFPTQEALQKAAEASSSATTAALRNTQQQPVPQENLLKENSYTLPALISLDSAVQRSRPYNGADVLVLQVWRDNPQNKNTPDAVSLGGAKIPIGAVVGGFPVRVSLGPQNAASAPETWKETLSSQSLWVTAGICRETNDDSAPKSRICSREYALPILEANGFSKFITLSDTVPSTKTTASGLRAPVSLVLGPPTR